MVGLWTIFLLTPVPYNNRYLGKNYPHSCQRFSSALRGSARSGLLSHRMFRWLPLYTNWQIAPEDRKPPTTTEKSIRCRRKKTKEESKSDDDDRSITLSLKQRLLTTPVCWSRRPQHFRERRKYLVLLSFQERYLSQPQNGVNLSW